MSRVVSVAVVLRWVALIQVTPVVTCFFVPDKVTRTGRQDCWHMPPKLTKSSALRDRTKVNDELYDKTLKHDASKIKDNNNNGREALLQRLLLAFPFVSGIFSFFTYESTWQSFHNFVEFANLQRNWRVVDGGKLQTQNITPLLNGPVLAAVGLLLATLVSTTISSLYQRQVMVRSCILQEMEELRYLQQLLPGFPADLRPKLQHHVDEYTRALFQNAMSSTTTNPLLAVKNTALRDAIMEMNRHVDGSSGVAPELLSQFYGTVSRIKTERSKRINAEASVFPATHYILLVLLASSVLLAFLLEANQNALFFLDEFELATCWAIMNGTFSSLAMVLYDLNTFNGTYSLFGANNALLVRFYRYATNQEENEEG